MKRLGLSVLTVLCFVGGWRAQAQIAPYAMFSLGHYSGLGVGAGTGPSQSGGMNALGGTFGVNDDAYHAGPIALGADVRGIVENSANSTSYGNKIAGFLIGPRITANTLVLPFRPYFQFEGGVVGTNNGSQHSKDAHGAYQFQVGGDFTLVPHLAARVEYGVGQLSTGNHTHHTLQTFGVGLVLRL